MQRLSVALLLVISSYAYSQGLLKYNPPKTGSPMTLAGGGTRSFGAKIPIKILAPRHTGLTSKSQPVLYWYSSLPKPQKLLLTITKEGDDQPALQVHLDNEPAQGLHSVRLVDYRFFLLEGSVYRWSVAVDDEEQNAGEAISNQTYVTLRYSFPSIPIDSLEELAAAGYWYDVLQELIETHSPQLDDWLAEAGIVVPIWE